MTGNVCNGGGAAGQTSGGSHWKKHGSSFYPFCGAGGGTDPLCALEDLKQISGGDSGPGGSRRKGTSAGLYGGGSGSHGDYGTGGGGGFTRGTVVVRPGNIIQVSVGHGGHPSYAPAGKGVVVVGWGGSIVVHK